MYLQLYNFKIMVLFPRSSSAGITWGGGKLLVDVLISGLVLLL